MCIRDRLSYGRTDCLRNFITDLAVAVSPVPEALILHCAQYCAYPAAVIATETLCRMVSRFFHFHDI